jgi:signal transduction histidine kinase
MLLSFGHRLQARSIAICSGSKEVLSLMERTSICAGTIDVPFGYRINRISIEGMPDYQVFVLAPYIGRWAELLFILVATLSLVFLNTVVLRSVSAGLWRDLILPLQGSNLDEVKIAEVYEMVAARDEANELKTRLSVSEAIRKFGQQVAHDIRSPLSALNVLAKKISSISDDERSMLSEAADRIKSIADDILDVEKRFLLEQPLAAFEVNELLDQVVKEKRLEIGSLGRNISIIFEPKTSGLRAIGDQGRVRRIVSNLLNNSIESFEGDGKILVGIDRDAQFVLISVVDYGRGISPEILKKIGAHALTTKMDGHGVGLSSAHQHIQSWGGSIAIQSSLGAGTQVTMKLKIVTTT